MDIETVETSEETTDEIDLAKEIAVAVAVTAATTVTTFAVMAGIGWITTKIMDKKDKKASATKQDD